jgi:mono/diheme cytochrome c family protein
MCRKAAALLFLLPVAAACRGEGLSGVDQGKALFEARCASCHAVGGAGTEGPDLAGVTERREGTWLFRFIRDPGGMVDGQDPTALFLLQKYGGKAMPCPGVSEGDVVWLMAFLSASRPKAPPPPSAEAGSDPLILNVKLRPVTGARR